MDFDDDIEKQIMLEMEAEIARNKTEVEKPTHKSSAVLLTAAPRRDNDDDIEEKILQRKAQKKREEEEQAEREREKARRLEAEEQARRQAEEQARRKAEEQARRKAEEQARRQAEEQARRKAEEQARRQAEEQARLEAEEQARLEAEEQARRQAEEQARRKAEEQARRQAEEQARRKAEEQARRQAEEQARLEAEEQARLEAEEQARRKAEEEVQREAEEQAHQEAEEQAQREAEEQAQREAEEQAHQEAEEQAQLEAEEQARQEAEEQAQREAEEQAHQEAEEQAQREAEEQARQEAEERAQREAEEQAQLEAEEQAHQEAEEQAQREAEEQARQEAEEQAQREAEEQAHQEAEEQAQREAEKQAQREAEEQARQEAEEQAQREAEEQAQLEAEEQARQEAEEQAQRDAEEQAQREAEEQAQREAEEQAQREADEQVKRGRIREDRGRLQSEEIARQEVQLKAEGKVSRSGVPATGVENVWKDQSMIPKHSMSSQRDNSYERALKNGLLDLGGDSDAVPEVIPPIACLAFEDEMEGYCRAHGVSESELRRSNVVLKRYRNMCEEGCCLFPPEEDASEAPIHVQVQLNLFKANQTILSLKVNEKCIEDHPQRTDVSKTALESVPLYFEDTVLSSKDADLLDSESPFNQPSEEVLSKNELSLPVSSSVQKAIGRIAYGDPIDLWEKASGHDTLEERGHFFGSGIRQENTTNFMWVSGVDVQKPIAPLKVFTGGRLIEIRATKIVSKVSEVHGEGTDPLLVAAALYWIEKGYKTKVSETFYFGNNLETFYPHHEPKEELRDNCVVAFVPNEFHGSLHIIARVYRPANYNFESFSDLYSRPDRYKSSHVAPMKQDTLLLAKSSDALQELGWMISPIEVDNKLCDVSTATITRKTFSDTDLMDLYLTSPTRLSSFQTVPLQLSFEVRDLSNFEVSFPFRGEHPTPQERETVVGLLDPDVVNARVHQYRLAPCSLFILSSGFFNYYINVFYLRFSYLKLSSNSFFRSLPGTHTTFYVHVCVKCTDDALTAEEALPCIYGRGIDCMKMVSEALSSSIVSVSLDWAMSDEFKIQLPLNLTDRHHFFLTLYAAYTKPGTNKPPVKVGYAVVPIVDGANISICASKYIDFISAEHAVVASAGGYLEGFKKADKACFINNGTGTISLSCHTKSSVYPTNSKISNFFEGYSSSLMESRLNADVLKHAGDVNKVPLSNPDHHRPVIKEMSDLTLPHIVGFYPFLCSYAMTIIGSPSDKVAMPHRLQMLDTLLLMTSKLVMFEGTSQSPRRQAKVTPSSRTSVENILYHYLTNDVLYEAEKCTVKCRLYAGMAEVWLGLLRALALEGPQRDPSERNILREISELSWYLFDVILRSAYMWAEEAEGGFGSKTSRRIFHQSFYDTISNLCLEALRLLCAFDESALVRRVALFLRNLMHCADRGQLLIVCSKVGHYFMQDGNTESLTNFLSYLMEAPDMVLFFFPSAEGEEPAFLAPMLNECFSTLLVHKNRDTRTPAASYFYLFLRRMSRDSRLTSDHLRVIAGQLYPLLLSMASNWKTFMALNEKSNAEIAVNERRKVLLIVLWVLYYAPVGLLNRWLLTEENEKNIAGFYLMLSEAQLLFRFDGELKRHQPVAPPLRDELLRWDARLSLLINTFAMASVNKSLSLTKHLLQTVKKHRGSPCVFPFFVLLENTLNLRNTTRSLQLGSALLLEVVRQLLPEIMSGKAKMCEGIVFLAFRLMSSCCQYVRRNASMTYFFMCQVSFSWHHSLSRMKALTANALVTVAESKSRDLRFAGRCIEYHFDQLMDQAKVEEDNFLPPSPGFSDRYEEDPSSTSGDAMMAFTHIIEPAFTSVKPCIDVPAHLTGKKAPQKKSTTKFSEDFGAMSSTVLQLFNDVLPLRVDSSLLFKEPKAATYLDIFLNFLHQNALKEGLKWLYRLKETHEQNGDHVEAGMILVLIASLGFRVTQLFYHAKGKSSKGARFPVALMDYVFWHDYVRILPDIDSLFSVDIIYPIAAALYVCPDEPCFTMEGQIKILKEAAEQQDKGMYYELSLQTIGIVDQYVRAAKDYSGAAVLHRAMASWCAVVSEPRPSSTYFFLWARMEREEFPSSSSGSVAREESLGAARPGATIRRIYKMPPKYTLSDFRAYAKEYVCSLFDDPSIVHITEELTETRRHEQSATPYKKKSLQLLNSSMKGQSNLCLLTVLEVAPHIPQRTTKVPEGYDKKVRLASFQLVSHVVGTTAEAEAIKPEDVPRHRMKILTYEVERTFPSTTTAIDVKRAEEVLLNPVETAALIMQSTGDTIISAPEDEELISVIQQALSIHGLPPGAFFKAAIAAMGHKEEIHFQARALANLVQSKMAIWTKLGVTHDYPDEYAVMIKAIADIECALIAYSMKDNSP